MIKITIQTSYTTFQESLMGSPVMVFASLVEFLAEPLAMTSYLKQQKPT